MVKGKEPKVKTFAEKLAELDQSMENIANLKKQAAELAEKLKKQESTLSNKQFKILSTELKLRGIDCSDLKFIVDACTFYKKYQAENEQSLVDAEEPSTIESFNRDDDHSPVDDANG